VLLMTLLALSSVRAPIDCIRGGDGVSILLIYFSIAARDLVGHGEAVRRIGKGELPGARAKVG
jgi:hypothetical protein